MEKSKRKEFVLLHPTITCVNTPSYVYGVSYYNNIATNDMNSTLPQQSNNDKIYEIVSDLFDLARLRLVTQDEDMKKRTKDMRFFKSKINRVPYDMDTIQSNTIQKQLFIIDYTKKTTCDDSVPLICKYTTVSVCKTKDELVKFINDNSSGGFIYEVFTSEIIEEEIDVDEFINKKANEMKEEK